jgi:hypothetical protein
MKAVVHVPPEDLADVPTAFPPEYVHLAWRRAALAEARRGLASFLRGPLGADPDQPRILCEDAPFAARFVPDAVVEALIEEFRDLEELAAREMKAFTMVRVRDQKPAAGRADGPRVSRRRRATSTTRTASSPTVANDTAERSAATNDAAPPARRARSRRRPPGGR